MSLYRERLESLNRDLPHQILCDTWLIDEKRSGEGGFEQTAMLGCWPDELDMDAIVRLAHAVGEKPAWNDYAQIPPVAQKLAERARPQPLDLEILRHLHHLQYICHHPRLHLRVEEERLPVSRARRTPVRAVADLVSHPGDWEHRSLKSIHPSRVLARQMEDEWNLYENRVAVRLVDHLLAYLARRLEELRKIKELLETSRDHSKETAQTSFWRARRISELWAYTLESKTENELNDSIKRLEQAQRDLQALAASPLYQEIPRHQFVAVSLKPTNILVNDLHYRKVAVLWRVWARFGHRRQETQEQKQKRQQQEAESWDQFVFHLVVRALQNLRWTATPKGEKSWSMVCDGYKDIIVTFNAGGIIRLDTADKQLLLFPICANLAGVDESLLIQQLNTWDKRKEDMVVVHTGIPLPLQALDRAVGWSYRKQTVLFACSPWGIDAEERMTRLLNGWLNRAAILEYPISQRLPSLPKPPDWEWIRYNQPFLVAFRAPSKEEKQAASVWGVTQARDLNAKAERAKRAKQAFEKAPLETVQQLQNFLELADRLSALTRCPVCDGQGKVAPRPGQKPDGSDAMWWAICESCKSEWGLRACTHCGIRYRALALKLTLPEAPLAEGWPDRVLGKDVWVQPCRINQNSFRCPECGLCATKGCTQCGSR